MKNKNLKKNVFVGFIIGLMLFSVLFFLTQNTLATQDDEDTQATLHCTLETDSGEIFSTLMPCGTYSFPSVPELNTGTMDHDVTRVEVSELQQALLHTNNKSYGGLTIPTNLTYNHITNQIPAYNTDAPKDTIISVNINMYDFLNTSKEVRPKGDTNGNWYGASMSSDGTKLFASENNGRLWYSLNSGTSWTELRPKGDVNCYWVGTSMSSDGTKLFVGEYNGRLWYSLNSGTSWTELRPKGDVNCYWYRVSMSSDGTKLFVGENDISDGRLWYSLNSGTSWTELRPKGDVNCRWLGVSMSSDGTKLFTGEWDGRLWYSLNSGTSWTELRPKGDVNGNWVGVLMSSDGTKLFVGEYTGRLWYSLNSGTSWTELRPKGDVNGIWLGVSMSSDGTKLFAGEHTGRLWYSLNSGTSWTELRPKGDVNGIWYAVSMSSDGADLLYGDSGGRLNLYISGSTLFESINTVQINDFKYQILGINYTQTAFNTSYSDSSLYNETNIFISYYFTSIILDFYDHISNLIILSQNLSLTFHFSPFFSGFVFQFSTNITYSINEWKVPTEVDLTINSQSVIDSTYNSGFCILSLFPSLLVITSSSSNMFFKLNISIDFSFILSLDVISKTYLRKSFELESDHIIEIEQINFDSNLVIKKVYLNNIDKGSSNPCYLSPSVSMDTGNIFYLEVILTEEIYLPLQYFYNNLGDGTSSMYMSGSTNTLNYFNINGNSLYSLIIPNGWYVEKGYLTFSNLDYLPDYVANYSEDEYSYGYSSPSYVDENVEWSADSYNTNANGTKDGIYKDGNYPGTYSFTNEIGKSGTNISFVNTATLPNSCSAKIDTILNNHRAILNLTHDGGGSYPLIIHNIDTAQTSGTWEWWWATSDVTQMQDIRFAGSTDPIITLRIYNSKYYYSDGVVMTEIVGDVPTNNIFDHFKIVFNCDSDTYDVYINKVLRVNDGAFYAVAIYVNNIQIWDISNAVYSQYIDAIGSPQEDSTYQTGDNYFYEYYMGTHTFEDYNITSNLTTLDGWTLTPATDCSININGSYNAHKKYVELYDNDQANYITIMHTVDTPLTDGTIEFWVRTDDITVRAFLLTLAHSGTGEKTWFYIQSSKFQYYDGTVKDIPNVGVPVNNQWHHVRIVFDCDTDKITYVIDGIDSGLLDFAFVATTIDSIQIFTSNDNTGLVLTEIDALSYSWEADINSSLETQLCEEYQYINVCYISDTLVAPRQEIDLYYKSNLTSISYCEIYQTYESNTNLITSVSVSLNILESFSFYNISSGFYEINLTFYDSGGLWESWILNYTIITTISISSNYKNPIFINEINTISVYIHADYPIYRIWDGNSSDYVLEYDNSSYPLYSYEFNFTFSSAIETLYNISIMVLGEYNSMFWCNITLLSVIEITTRMDFNNIYSSYYQDESLYIQVLLRDLYNNPLASKNVYYSITDPDDIAIASVLTATNSSGIVLIQLDFNTSYEIGFYHLYANYTGDTSYTGVWKIQSFQLRPILRSVNSSDISLQINGYSVISNYIQINHTNNFTLTNLNTATFDMSILCKLNYTETIPYSEYLDYDYSFMATSDITQIILDTANLINYPSNFSLYYFDNLVSSNYAIVGTTFSVLDIIGDTFYNTNDFDIKFRYYTDSIQRTQITATPRTDSNHIVFTENLLATRTFSYWYVLNSYQLNTFSLYHQRTGITIAYTDFTKEASKYYFEESSLTNDLYINIVDYKWNPVVNSTVTFDNGTKCTLEIKYYAQLDVRNATIVLNLKDIGVYAETWDYNATQSDLTCILEIPNINFTTSQQTITLTGLSSIPMISFNYFTNEDGFKISDEEYKVKISSEEWRTIKKADWNDLEVYMIGYLTIPKYSKAFIVDLELDWQVDGIHYGNNYYDIQFTGLFECEGFGTGITTAYLRFKTNPLNNLKREQIREEVTYKIDSKFNLDDVDFIFYIEESEYYNKQNLIKNLKKEIECDEIVEYYTIEDRSYYMILGMELNQGINEIVITYKIESMLAQSWVLLIVGIGMFGFVGIYVTIRYKDNRILDYLKLDKIVILFVWIKKPFRQKLLKRNRIKSKGKIKPRKRHQTTKRR